MFPETLETERLRLERLSAERVDPFAFYEVASRRNPTIEEELQYHPRDPLESVKDAVDRLAELDSQWTAGERAEWLIRPKEGEDGAGTIAGVAALVPQWERDLAYPGIWLRKPFWGRGYSGERADALLEVAFERLDVSLVAIPVQRENEQSYRAVEKYVERYGGRYEGLLRNHGSRTDGPLDHHRFSISKAEYEAAVGDDDGDQK